ncbi:MAG TPA: CBS domain-containing protein, partial [Phototrophicaceae bacterium]|nr:CBS domain-containing protein [Phototrophicaceae bacterium]
MPFTAQDLITDKRPPISVTLSTSLHEVLEIMVENDFSQLPVVDKSNKPQGIVASYSILQALKTFGVSFESLKVNDV